MAGPCAEFLGEECSITGCGQYLWDLQLHSCREKFRFVGSSYLVRVVKRTLRCSKTRHIFLTNYRYYLLLTKAPGHLFAEDKSADIVCGDWQVCVRAFLNNLPLLNETQGVEPRLRWILPMASMAGIPSTQRQRQRGSSSTQPRRWERFQSLGAGTGPSGGLVPRKDV